jgi:hypothetical protein
MNVIKTRGTERNVYFSITLWIVLKYEVSTCPHCSFLSPVLIPLLGLRAGMFRPYMLRVSSAQRHDLKNTP